MKRGFQVITQYKNQDILLPKRATTQSAGYDFRAATNETIAPEEVCLVPTGIKAYMQEDEVLKLYPRSSLAIKRYAMLANNVGIIDADYYNNQNNEGHIMIPIYNFSKKMITIKQGERIAQGIFQKYLKVDQDDIVETDRMGGFGSSGK